MTRISGALLKYVSDKVAVPQSRRLLHAVETAVQPCYLTRHFSATLEESPKNMLFQSTLDKRLLGIKMTLIQIQLARNSTQQRKTRRRKRRGGSLQEVNTLTLLEPPCHQPRLHPHHVGMLVNFQANTHFADMFSPSGCYIAQKVAASASPLYSLSIACFQVIEYPHTLQRVQHASSASKDRSAGAWEWGDSRAMELGGKAYGLYPPALPSATAAHAPHLLGAVQSPPWS